MQNVFYPDLNEFCQKYLDGNRVVSPLEAASFPILWKQQEARLFEQLLLFDRISFKVYGENIPLVVLLRMLGEKGLEALIEQDAMRFVLWTPMVGYMKSEIVGVEPLVFGNTNSPAHCEPDASIELGFKWMSDPPSANLKRRLLRKVRPLYELPDKDLAGTSVQATKSAFNSGKLLSEYHLSPLLGLEQVAKLRGKDSSAKFRGWLASVDGGVDGREITKQYVNSIADAKGLFESTGGKFTKSVAMASVGAGVGAAVGGLEGAGLGVLAGKVLDIGAELGLDLLDSFLLERLTKGWTPRMFFDDLRKISKGKSK